MAKGVEVTFETKPPPPTVQEALEGAMELAAKAAVEGNPEPLRKLLDGLSELLWEADRRARNGGHDPRTFPRPIPADPSAGAGSRDAGNGHS